MPSVPRRYVCPQCGAQTDVPADEVAKVGIKAASGAPNVWVVTAGRVEIHRCTVSNPRRSPTG